MRQFDLIRLIIAVPKVGGIVRSAVNVSEKL